MKRGREYECAADNGMQDTREIIRIPTSTMLYLRRGCRRIQDGWPENLPLHEHMKYVFGDNGGKFWLNLDDVPPVDPNLDFKTSIWEFKQYRRDGLRLMVHDDPNPSMNIEDCEGFITRDRKQVYLFNPIASKIQILDDDKVKGKQQQLITDIFLRAQARQNVGNMQR